MKQPEALRLADALQAGADDPMWANHCEMSKRTASIAAAELRRLHAVNAELLEALEKLARLGNGEHYGNSDGNMIARAAIAKATGQTI